MSSPLDAYFFTFSLLVSGENGQPVVESPQGHGELCNRPDRHGRHGEDVRPPALRSWLEVIGVFILVSRALLRLLRLALSGESQFFLIFLSTYLFPLP